MIKRIVDFADRQVRYIAKHGLRGLYQKLFTSMALSLAVPIIVLVRILRPVLLIRFGGIQSDRIGHFSQNVELYLSEKELDPPPIRTVDIFHYLLPISNLQLKKMSDRELRVSSCVRWLERVNCLLPGGEIHNTPLFSRLPDGPRNMYEPLTRTPVHLTFTPEEERFGREGLSRLGIPEGAPFVPFIARDTAYLDTVYPGLDWGYHDYRDSSIQNYVAAAEELSRRGYFTIRMGAVVKEALPTSNPMIIDYATKGRTDFLDIYLSAKCSFFISSDVGLDTVPIIFRRPLVCTNFALLGWPHTFGPGDLFIPKKLWHREEGRFLTFHEILGRGAGILLRTEQYQELGLQLIENTPDEINGIAMEMEERLSGTWTPTDEDEELQQRFWFMFKVGKVNEPYLPRIGTHFLRVNRPLLA